MICKLLRIVRSSNHMADVVSAAKRSQMMAGIRAKDTQPEMIIRRALHARGFRYRLHAKNLPGKPDLVFPRYRSVLFVHGCFWHSHQCSLFKMPSTRTEFWESKLKKNRENDVKAREELVRLGWRVTEVWECELRATRHQNYAPVVESITKWLSSSSQT